MDTRVITLKDLWELFLRRFPAMLLAATVGIWGLFFYAKLIQEPEYESTATLYILRQSGGEDYDDFSLALKVVDDSAYVLKSHAVLDEVIRQLNLDMTVRELDERVSTENPEETRILEVTVRAESPEQAKAIVDALCAVGEEKIAQTLGIAYVQVFEPGTVAKENCNALGIQMYVLASAVAAVAVYGMSFVAFVMYGEKKPAPRKRAGRYE